MNISLAHLNVPTASFKCHN